ncbi:hypothetical protein GE061_015713 [Apolygus lucorum]|uniref:Uncharacterized protein n=1 Tax=Apolygus lucorum TaxID=248454 RepID=A0A6A4JMH8_APOLU|nr:hypothetical protein GE061_015713 [Apolygus lucorum]
MLESFQYFVIILSIVSIGETFRCYSCTSLIQVECEDIYVFFTTYFFMETQMSKDCSKEQNACVSYAFGTDSFDSGFEEQRSMKYYIQRDCAAQSRQEACNQVAQMLMLLNVTIFNPDRNCRWCNGTSLCNNWAIPEVRGTSKALYTDNDMIKVGLAVLIALFHL